eukprot:COSAG02_NODE_8806_length_2437_cov_2.487169_2_plen_293_part_01
MQLAVLARAQRGHPSAAERFAQGPEVVTEFYFVVVIASWYTRFTVPEMGCTVLSVFLSAKVYFPPIVMSSVSARSQITCVADKIMRAVAPVRQAQASRVVVRESADTVVSTIVFRLAIYVPFPRARIFGAVGARPVAATVTAGEVPIYDTLSIIFITVVLWMPVVFTTGARVVRALVSRPLAMAVAYVPISVSLTVAVIAAVIMSITGADRALVSRPLAMAVASVPISIIFALAVIAAVIMSNARLTRALVSRPLAMAVASVPISISLTVAMIAAVIMSVTGADRALVSRPLP